MAARNVMGFNDYSHVIDVDVYPKGNDGADGISLGSIKINSLNHLICTFTDGTVTDAGIIDTSKVQGGFNIRIVDTLPTTDINANTLYCVPAEEQKDDNKYDEFVYLDGKGWERVGSAEIDLSGYYTKEEINEKEDLLNNAIKSTNEAIEKHTNSKTIETTNALREQTYYLLGTANKDAETETKLVNTLGYLDEKDEEGNKKEIGVKYIAGSDLKPSELYLDDQKITTELFFEIS